MTLQQYLDAYAGRTFEWGRDDCALFAARWVENKTGKNPLVGQPKWYNLTDAARVIKSFGGMEKASLHVLGTPAKTCKEGDVALLQFPHNCMGIVGHGCVHVLTMAGMNTVSLGMAKYVWSV